MLNKKITVKLKHKVLYNPSLLTTIYGKSVPNQKNNWYDLININFLRKERLYTKLKYSRSPAYDIVSGGAAAILAGFIGFLVSEKFGFELADSGDFYYLFMYIVFLGFILRPFLVSLETSNGLLGIFKFNDFYKFYANLSILIIKYLKSKL
jgi:hypothetical protein